MNLTKTLGLSAVAAAAFAASLPATANTFAGLSQLGSTYFHTAGGFNAEIPAYDPITRTLWVAGITGVDVLDVTPTGLSFNSRIDVSAFGSINSVAIHGGIAAFALENTTNRELPGIVQFYNTSTRALTGGTNTVTVGSLPDMLTFSANGSKLLVANEGTPTVYGSPTDPVGSVSIIDMATRTATHVGLGGVIPTSGSGLRNSAATGMNYEPEYIAVNAAGTQAWVTLQEHNALARLDLSTQQFTSIIGLGLKDYSLAQNAIDPSNNAPVALAPVNLKGAYQPDAVVAFTAGGKTFLAMANEGDAREDDADVGRAGTLFGTAAPRDRINVIKDLSTADNLVSMGGRSFSIRDADGNLVYDSGNILEVKAIAKGIYDDGRSDDKGVEPEGVALLTINGRTYAFVGLERTSKGAVALFDITDPANASFVDMIVTNGTNRPEGLAGFAQDGMFYLAISNEGTGNAAATGMSTALYSLAPVPEPEIWATLLAGLAMLGGVARRRRTAGR